MGCPAPVAVILTCSPSQVPVSITALNRSTAARPSPTASTEDQVRQPGFDKVPALLPRSRSGTPDSPHLKGCHPVPTCQSAGNIFPRKPLQRWRNRLGGSSPQPSTQLFGQPTSASGTSRSSIWGNWFWRVVLPWLDAAIVCSQCRPRAVLFAASPHWARLRPMAWIDGSGNAS